MIKSLTAAIALAVSFFPTGVTNIQEESEGLEYSKEQNQELWTTWCDYYQASCQNEGVFVESVFKKVYFAVTEQSEELTYQEVFARQVNAFGLNALRIAVNKHDLKLDADDVRERMSNFIEATQEDSYRHSKIIQMLYLEFYQGDLDAIDVLRAEAQLGIAIAEKHLGVLLNRPKA
jgi:translation elongation factor EF-1beta